MWLLGLYYDALKNNYYFEKNKQIKQNKKEKLEKFKEQVEKTFVKEMNDRGCVGSIAEIYDSKAPYLPKGAIAQGWSVAEIFRIIYEKI